jgi:hypothetical protein
MATAKVRHKFRWQNNNASLASSSWTHLVCSCKDCDSDDKPLYMCSSDINILKSESLPAGLQLAPLYPGKQMHSLMLEMHFVPLSLQALVGHPTSQPAT